MRPIARKDQGSTEFKHSIRFFAAVELAGPAGWTEPDHRMKVIIFLLVVFAVMGGTFFGSAGRWDLPMAWISLGTYAAFMVLAQTVMDPDLRRERLKPAPGGIDRQIRWAMLPFMLGYWVVAGLDIRWHGPGNVSRGWQTFALVAMIASLGLVLWALTQNRFFSPVVRIQTERGHHLITSGPYQWVRHPGYLGGAGSALCGAIALGSWWALLPAAGVAGVLVRRVILEDLFLHRELSGYQAYAAKVRYRLLPGIW
jgi:protein-S-isoprenylcysteine O-methyltransferase Ste14